MSTSIATIQEQMRKALEAQKGSVPKPTGFSISTKNKMFTLPNGQSNPGPMNVVILDYRNLNAYYSTPYNAQNPKPPSCFAIASQLADLAPHEDAEEPQADDCASCVNNQWKSAPGGGNGKACKNMVRLAVAAVDADENTSPMILKISPTGLKSWAPLVKELDDAGMLPIQVVTEIKFDEHLTYPSLQFKALKAHDKLELFWALREKAQSILDLSLSSD